MKNITNHNGDIVIYQSEDGNTRINVNLQGETVWLSQQQMSELFKTDRTSILRTSTKQKNLTKNQLVHFLHRFKMKVSEKSLAKYLTII